MKECGVLSIAGFDPCGGAGVLCDCKVIEAHGISSFGVCSAITFQNDEDFNGLRWIPIDEIESQLSPLLSRYEIRVVKIGLIESLEILQKVVALVAPRPIIWDPVLKASAGFVFHNKFDRGLLGHILKLCALITPNSEEVVALCNSDSPLHSAQSLSEVCPVLLKGGHVTGALATDTLWIEGKKVGEYSAPRIATKGIHGSGCALSSAIAAELAKGASLSEACENGRRYLQDLLGASQTRLPHHWMVHAS